MVCKNVLLIFPQVLFDIFTNWTPTTVYDEFLLSTYNHLWTIFPPVEYGLFEQDLSFKSMMTYPRLYIEARSGRYLSYWRFALEFISVTYQAIVIFFINVYLPSQVIFDSNGSTMCIGTCANILFVSIVLCANIQAAVRKHAWNAYLFLSLYLSIFGFFLFTLPYGSLPTFAPSMFYIPQKLCTQPLFYLTIIISVIASLAPEALFRFFKALWFPSFTRIIREKEQLAYDGYSFFARG